MKKVILMIISLIFLISCTTQKIVEVPIETIKTQYIHDTQIDSIYIRDSIDRWRNGDTIFIYKEHTKYKYLNKTDTVIRTDTIPKIVKSEVVKEVIVNHIKWYQKVLMWVGGIVSLVLLGCAIYKVKIKQWK